MLTHDAKSTRTSLLGIGLLITLAACGGAAPSGTSRASIGTVPASALPSPSARAASALPSASARALGVGAVVLESGDYVTGSPFLSRVTFSAPPGWYASMGGPYAVFLDPSLVTASDDDGLVELVIFDKVYADPCHPDKGLLSPSPGPSVDDLAKALASVPSLVATTPTDVTVAGYHGKQVTLTAPTSITACSVWQTATRRDQHHGSGGAGPIHDPRYRRPTARDRRPRTPERKRGQQGGGPGHPGLHPFRTSQLITLRPRRAARYQDDDVRTACMPARSEAGHVGRVLTSRLVPR